MIRHLATVLVAAFLVLTSMTDPALAHGIGGRLDLPIPISYFIGAAGLVVVASFVALAVLWPDPRLQDGPLDRELGFTTRPVSGLLGALGLVGLLLVVAQVVPPLIGIDRVVGRPTIAPVTVWVVMWLIVPFGSAVIGNWYRDLNPWTTLSRLARIGGRESRSRGAMLGVWPAAVLLIAFTWLELVSPNSGSPTTLGWAALIYSAVVIAAIAALGRLTGALSFDFFTVYNRMLSAISPFGRSEGRRLRWRGWLRALPALPEWKGFSFFVLAAIGTVSYDGASGTTWFRDATGAFGTRTLGRTILLLLFVGVVLGAYWVACWAASRMTTGFTAAEVVSRFAHTLVPIALAYAVAHYFTLIIFEGQQLIAAVSDPLGLGWDLFGTADRSVDFFITSAEPVWYLQVGVIVLGHILGVVLAHDRALADFGREAVRSQYAMLLLMVGLTSLGLVILAG